jgi:hypothetical protein
VQRGDPFALRQDVHILQFLGIAGRERIFESGTAGLR